MPNVINPRPSNRSYIEISLSTAADGVSESFDITGLKLSFIAMSTSWTGANLGFKGSVPGTTEFFHVYDTAGNFLTYPTSANRIIAFDNAPFAGLQKLQLVSESSAGVATAQGAARTIKLGLAP